MPVYPENTTLQESYLCFQCPFWDDKMACKRAQEIVDGCLILMQRQLNGI